MAARYAEKLEAGRGAAAYIRRGSLFVHTVAVKAGL